MRVSSHTSLQPLEPATPVSAWPGLQTALAERPGRFLVPSFGASSAATVAEAPR